MRIEHGSISIELETQKDVDLFWNVIAFALDLQTQREKEGKACMTEDELKMARKLYDATKGDRL